MALDDGKVSAEYLKQAAARIRPLKELSYQRMVLSAGATVLDVGCGPGMDTVPLAQLVGPHGEVMAVDNDQAMLDEAMRHAEENGVAARISHRLGSALALPLADASVDSCRAERLLQVMAPEHEHAIVNELLRVTKPGGHIVLVDADWGSASVDFSDALLERRLMHLFATQMRPHGFAGRRLYPLCRELGLRDITLDVVAVVQHHLDETPFGTWLIDTAQKAAVMNEREAQLWREELTARSAAGRFYASVNMVVVSGRVPGGQ